MIELAEVVSRVDGFDAMPPRERIQIFAWYLHTQRSMEFFDKEAIKVYLLGALRSLRPAFALSSFSGVHPPVFLVRAAHHDPERLIRDSPLQRLHFVGNCATSAPVMPPM
jgi:hypothetical protein